MIPLQHVWDDFCTAHAVSLSSVPLFEDKSRSRLNR
jgi:hypothetical protein